MSHQRAVVLTGASSGIGAAICDLLLAQGHRVLGVARRADTRPPHANYQSLNLDLSDLNGVNVSVDFESTRQMAKEEDLKRLNTFMTGFFEAAKSDPSMAKVMRSVLPLLMEEMTKSSNLENSAKIAATMKEALAQAVVEEQQKAAREAQEAQQKNQAMEGSKAPTVNISFKDLPPAGKIQAAAKYGIQLTADDVRPQIEAPRPLVAPGVIQ